MSSIRDRLKPSPEPEDDRPGFDQHDTRSGGSHGGGDVVSVETEPPLPAEARRAERIVASLFVLGVLGAVGFVATYIFWPYKYNDGQLWHWFTPVLGGTMAIALFGIGAGAVVWAKTLMDDPETVQERHDLNSAPADRAEAAEALKAGAAATGIGKYPILRRTFLLSQGALGALAVPLLFSLGHFQHKERELTKTGWKRGSRLLDELGRPVKPGDIEVGGVKSVFPDVPGGRRMADSAALLIRMRPDQLKPMKGRENWVVDNQYIVYSVICTHLGCPVKLYEQQTHHLFCPCHQSTFDAANGAKVLFGPAARNLPQLAITVDADGYFVARDDFNEPVGPSFWERKPHYKEPTYDNGTGA